MQPTNQPRAQKSRCMYCGSPDIGKGCRYAPHGVHFHPNDSTKCAYCGSKEYGKGCRLNPSSNMHIHGIGYNSMFKENVQSFLDNKFFVNEIKKQFTEFECFKLGLIDNNGNKIKDAVTEQERHSVSPMIKTIIRIKRYLGSKVQLIEGLESVDSKLLNEKGISKYQKFLAYKDKINDIVNELYKTLDEAHRDGLEIEDVQKLIEA